MLNRHWSFNGIIFTIVIFFTMVSPVVYGGDFKLTDPNHYIILVDASGSTVQNQVIRSAYYSAASKLVKNLFEDGFKQEDTNIPRFKTGRDYLTIYNFGIGNGGTSNAYQQIKYFYDYSLQYLHPICEANKNVSQDWVKSVIFPKKTYNYSIYSWAKPLGLEHAGQAAQNLRIAHTYLIVLTDAKPNGISLSDEVIEIERFSNKKSRDQERSVRREIANGYFWGLQSGVEGLAYEKRITNKLSGSACDIFIEGFEVFSRERQQYRSSAKAFEPLSAANIHWVEDRDEDPVIVVSLPISPEFNNWHGNLSSLQYCLHIGSDNYEWNQQNVKNNKVKITLNGKAPKGGSLFLDLFSRRLESDNILGESAVNYHWRSNIILPDRPSQTIWNKTQRALIVIGFILLAVIIALLVYFGVFFPHASFLVNSCGKAFTLEYGNKYPNLSILAPRHTDEIVLKVKLIHPILQWLFGWLRQESIQIKSTDGKIIWAIQDMPEILKLPYNYNTAHAQWQQLP